MSGTVYIEICGWCCCSDTDTCAVEDKIGAIGEIGAVVIFNAVGYTVGRRAGAAISDRKCVGYISSEVDVDTTPFVALRNPFKLPTEIEPKFASEAKKFVLVAAVRTALSEVS